jgi:hypothetical protein
MYKVDCVTAQKTDTLAQAINDRITTLVGSGYKIMNVYPVTIGDSRYVAAIINYETSPASEAQYVTIDALSGMLTTYAKKSDIPTVPTKLSALANDVGYAKKTDIPAVPAVPTKVSQLTNDSGYITRSTADGLYVSKTEGT